MSFKDGNLHEAVKQREERIDKLLDLNGKLYAETNAKARAIQQLKAENDELREMYVLDMKAKDKRIEQLEAENEEVLEAWSNQAKTIKEQFNAIHQRDELIRDYEQACGGLCVDCDYGNPHYPDESDEICLLSARAKALGIEVRE